MSPERLAGLSPSSVALLGPSGLAKVFARKAAIELRLNGSPQPVTPVAATPERRSHPLRTAVFAAAVVLAVGLAVERAVPMLSSAADQGTRNASTSNWPICPRLDRYVDGCIYRVGGNGGLTLEVAGQMLAIPTDQLAASNTHITTSITTILPPGSPLVVWRGKLKLKEKF